MELPKGQKGSQKAIFLAGILLGCALQLGMAHQRVFIILEPPRAQEGQDVTLAVQGGPRQFERCSWYYYNTLQREEPQRILAYIQKPGPREETVTTRSSRETMKDYCSLRITDLRWSDTGNYSVTLEVDPTSQSPDKRLGQEDEFYEGSIYLQVSASNQISIPVQCVPPRPNQGQEVTLALQGIPQELASCEWFKAGPSGNLQPIAWYSPREQLQNNHTKSNKRVTVGRDCSLRITKLITADSGNYTVKMEFFVDRQQHRPVNGTEPQGPGEIREYWGQVKLQVNQGSEKGKISGRSAGLSYSAGIIVGSLLGFFAWMDTFTTLFCLLRSSSSQPGRLQ